MSLLQAMPKMCEGERFELVISRRSRLDRLFSGGFSLHGLCCIFQLI